jgi:hypothetical protein
VWSKPGPGQEQEQVKGINMLTGPKSPTLFVNTPRGNYEYFVQSGMDSEDVVNTGVKQASNGCMDKLEKSESKPKPMRS